MKFKILRSKIRTLPRVNLSYRSSLTTLRNYLPAGGAFVGLT
jgi:hypothetical protein